MVSTFTDWHDRRREQLISMGQRMLKPHLDDIDFYSHRSSKEWRREADFEELCIAIAILHLKAEGDWE